ncbi:alpha/beta hydrolase [Jannaschia sp. 2305UL9-9]|uniref:alpha/beta hydrolase n=1 Tax=Jannaschia sp. 2305UL9-9 TaxID=3121638 RepID=UPI003526DF36
MAILRIVVTIALILGVAIGALWLIGPYEEVDRKIAFDAEIIPENLDGWLADAEAQVLDLRPGAAKRILWANVPGRRTDLAIVYIHGFSADLWETRPVPDRVAENLGANLFYTRLTGHGRDGAAMAEPDAGDWLEDVAEAMAVGRRLGDRVVIISASTGGTLASVLAADPAFAAEREGLAGIVLISPNFRVANPMSALLSWPAARYWVPFLAGETRSFEPENARHAQHWTTSYPTVSVLPMQALVDHAATLNWAATEVPALFYFSPEDTVVDPQATADVAARWGAPATVERVDLPEGDDPSHHVIAGDILSPAQTPDAITRLTEWIGAL